MARGRTENPTSKATGVTITTIKFQIQFPEVDTAFAGARILNGTISA